LQVTGIGPGANSVAASRATSVTAEFDRPIDAKTVDRSTFFVFGRLSGAVDGTFRLDKQDRAVTFTPKRPFTAGELVDVILSHDIADNQGVRLRDEGYAWTFWTPSGPSKLDFQLAGTLFAGPDAESYGGLGADLNGDGALDLAIVNEESHDVKVFLNNGDGSYGDYVSYPIGADASPNAGADFNKDGFIDLATANISDGTVSVLLGNGDGSFQAQAVYPVGERPRGIAVLDVNGDGYVDIVVCNSGSSDLSLLLNNGDGTFAAEKRFFATPGAQFFGLEAADMNGDGIMDLVAGAQGLQGVYVLLGRGDGTFEEGLFQNALAEPWVLRAGDLNGDGHPDVAIASRAQNSLVILFGDGKGNLSEPVSYPTANSISVGLGDLDGDGSLDVVVSGLSSTSWIVFTNDGTGQLTERLVLRATAVGSCAILHDFDGDGILDITGIDEVADEVTLWRNVPE
jgi:hypothetical protein